MSAAPVTVDELWRRVPGQHDAVRQLRASVRSPTHAYLISGPEGSGKRELATAFAASLLARDIRDDAGSGDDAGSVDDTGAGSRVAQRVMAGDHPGFVLVERDGPFITADDARGVVERAARSPLEGSLQVIVITDFHLVRDAGPMLLKSIEEPPPTTIFVLLAEHLPRELETISSRCVNVVLSAVPIETLVEHLVAEGVDPQVAHGAAEASGGSLSRSRLLARDPGVVHRRELWYTAPERLNGRGARVCEIVDELLASIESIKEPLAQLEAEELAALEARHESMGSEVRKVDVNKVKDRYKRAARRAHTDELRVGLGVLVSRYRDDMLDGGDPETFARVAGSVQQVSENLVFNVGDELALRALFMALPRLDSATV